MNKKPLRECNKAGCPELTRDSYCDKHKGSRERQYDKYERNQESREFYQSISWKKVRAYVMARDNGLCQMALRDKRIVKADLVHHIFPLQQYPELGLNPDNLISLSHDAHNNLHNKDGSLNKEGQRLADEKRYLIEKE